MSHRVQKSIKQESKDSEKPKRFSLWKRQRRAPVPTEASNNPVGFSESTPTFKEQLMIISSKSKVWIFPAGHECQSPNFNVWMRQQARELLLQQKQKTKKKAP